MLRSGGGCTLNQRIHTAIDSEGIQVSAWFWPAKIRLLLWLLRVVCLLRMRMRRCHRLLLFCPPFSHGFSPDHFHCSDSRASVILVLTPGIRPYAWCHNHAPEHTMGGGGML